MRSAAWYAALAAAISIGAAAAGANPPPPAPRAPVALAGTLAPDIAQAQTITIDDVWKGFSRASPIEAHYRLERTADGFHGHADFSAGGGYPGGPRHAGADIVVPQQAAAAFFSALGQTMIHAGGYAPARRHTDDYPDFTLTLGAPGKTVVFASQSQGKERNPWQVKIGAHEYVSDSGQPAAALETLQPYLKRDVLERMLEELKR